MHIQIFRLQTAQILYKSVNGVTNCLVGCDNFRVYIVKVGFSYLIVLRKPKKYSAATYKRLKIFLNALGFNEFGRKKLFDLINELSLTSSPFQEWSCFALRRASSPEGRRNRDFHS